MKKISREFIISVGLLVASFFIAQGIIIPDIVRQYSEARVSYVSSGKSRIETPVDTNFCDKVYMSSGHDDFSHFNDFYTFDLANGWQNITPPPFVTRAYPLIVSYDSKIWVIGGRGGGWTPLNDMWVYDGLTWSHFDNDPIAPGIQDAPWDPRMHFTGAVFDGKIWIFGGVTDIAPNYRNDVWSFDGTSWSHFDNDSIAPGIQDAPWAPMAGHKSVVFDNKVWLISGGYFWVFDGVSWAQVDNDPVGFGIQPMTPFPYLFEPVMQVFDNKIWFMGGWDGAGHNEVWNFDGTNWSHLDNDSVAPGIQDAPWPTRWEFSSFIYENKMWIMAGSGPFKNDVWSFDGAAWTKYDNDSIAPGIQDAPWAPRDGLGSLYVDCDIFEHPVENYIKGTVYEDVNHNGSLNSAEPKLPGVQIGLYLLGQTMPSMTATTQPVPNEGQYLFGPISDNNYYVALVDESPYFGITQPVVSTGFVPAHDYVHGVVATGSVYGGKDFGVITDNPENSPVVNTDIKITKDLIDSTLTLADRNITWRVRATNLGPHNATNISISDLVPAGLIYISHVTLGSSETYNSLSNIYSIPQLGIGSTTWVDLTLKVPNSSSVCGIKTNTVTLTALDQVDTNASNNQATSSLTLRPCVDPTPAAAKAR